MPTQTPNFGLNKYNAGETGWSHSDTVDLADSGLFTYIDGGEVLDANAGVLEILEVDDGETYSVFSSGLLLSDGQPAPTNLDLVISTFDNAGGSTKQTTVIDGDGTKQNDNTTTSSYTNTTGSTQSVGLLVDNGEYNAGTGADVDVVVHYQRGIQ